MAVYVDDMYRPYKRMRMCHMIADTPDELRAIAQQIGVSEKWLQNGGSYREHYDVSMSCRAKAVELGAVEITQREIVVKIRERCGSYGNMVSY